MPPVPRPAILAALAALAGLPAAMPAAAEVPAVVTDTPVVQSLVAAVMGDLGTPSVLLDRGADAHDFQLRPSQVRALGGADLVFWTGPGMTPWLARALEARGADAAVALIDAPGTHLRRFAEDSGAAATDDAHDHEGHDHEGTDPHAWLDPANAMLWTDVIAEALAAADGANAATYRANAAAARTRIEVLDRDLADRLTPARGKGLILGHDAYGYFAARYGLTVVGTLAEGDAAEPGAAHVAGLRKAAEAGAVACAFPEAGHDPRPLERLVADTPARLGRPLDPEGRLAEPGAALYPAILDGIAAAIADCALGG